jgi:outer membrane biosynthesis protein TonB
MVNKNNNEPRNNIDTRSINEEEAVYVDGYDRSRLLENNVRQERQIITENNNTATGLILGFALVILTGLGVTAFYAIDRNNQTTTPVNNSEIAKPEQPKPEKETKIIERTIEKTQQILPVPQSQPIDSTPSNSQSSEKPININVPVIGETTKPLTNEQKEPETIQPQVQQESTQSQTKQQDRENKTEENSSEQTLENLEQN